MCILPTLLRNTRCTCRILVQQKEYFWTSHSVKAELRALPYGCSSLLLKKKGREVGTFILRNTAFLYQAFSSDIPWAAFNWQHSLAEVHYNVQCKIA